MQILLYNFKKRENSTAQPSSGASAFECWLKAPTSAVNPVIQIDFSDQSDPDSHIFNYAYIPDFGRYYFISDVRSVRGMLWEYVLACDILATYKADIADSTLYLTRCSSRFDGNIIDEYYPLSTDYTVSISEENTPWIYTGEDVDVYNKGCFIVGVVADPYADPPYAGSYGSIQYYAMPLNGLYDLVHALLQNATYTNFDQNISIDLQKAMIDPLSFIKSCIWAPGIIYTGLVQTENQTMHIWDWVINAPNKRLTNNPPYSNYIVNLPVAAHPNAAARGAYLNIAPFTKTYIVCAPFGVFEIDTTLIKNAATVSLNITYDLITGGGVLDIKAGNVLLGRHKSQIGVPIQLTQVYHEYINGALGAFSGVTNAVVSGIAGGISGVVSGVTSAIGSAVNAMKPIQSSIGGNGGFSDLRGKAAIYQIFYKTLDEDREHVGRPLCQNVLVSTLAAGTYCLAMDGDVSITGTAGEQQRLRDYLTGGFYYE